MGRARKKGAGRGTANTCDKNPLSGTAPSSFSRADGDNTQRSGTQTQSNRYGSASLDEILADPPPPRISGSGTQVDAVDHATHRRACLRAVFPLDLSHAELGAQEKPLKLALVAYHARNIHPLMLHAEEQCEYCVAAIAALAAELRSLELLGISARPTQLKGVEWMTSREDSMSWV